MRIQHNIMAMNAYRNYNSNVSAMKSNLEKLSSGYKINRAGDDAAGLAISEKMRAQITGLNAAQKNVKDGISLVQTAEGAMQEVQDMLNRMVYLATQSANGTYDNEVDRANLQKELEQLTSEIDRISDSANFNGIKLLDGSKADPIKEATTTYSLDPSKFTSVTIADTKANPVIGADTVEFSEATEAAKTKFEVDLSQVKWENAATNDTAKLTIGGYSVDLTATTAGPQDVYALLKTAATGVTQVTVNTGGGKFNVTFDDANKKITFDLATLPTAAATAAAADLKSNYTVTLTGADGYQWNGGTRVLTDGANPVAGTPANTVITAANLGIQGDGADDGFAMTIDGKTFVLAVGDDTNVPAADKLPEGVVRLEISADADQEAVMKALANAIDGAGTIWSAGVNKDGNLTLAQTDTSDDAKNAQLKTKEDIEKTITKGTLTETVGEAPTKLQQEASPLTLQIGDTADPYNKLSVKIGDIHAKALGIDTKSINIKTQDAAADAVAKIKDAINTVSSIRGDLGATQNRLEHTANNLSVMQENIQDAESSIRDTDVAEEMMAYTKNNILIQSAQAMLAQANQIPQGVLQLLQ